MVVDLHSNFQALEMLEQELVEEERAPSLCCTEKKMNEKKEKDVILIIHQIIVPFLHIPF